MRKSLIIFFTLLVFASCGNNEKENKSIKNSVLDVCLGDNRTECKEKLDKQGYKWKEQDFSDIIPDAPSDIAVEETVMIDGLSFDKVVYNLFDAKVMLITLGKKYSSESEAMDGFTNIEKTINDKYGQFKTSKTNDRCLKYLEYDDGITNLSVMLSHNSGEEVPELFQDAETLEMAKESWDVSVLYMPVGQGNSDKKEKNAF